jgi:hypothetical protein
MSFEESPSSTPNMAPSLETQQMLTYFAQEWQSLLVHFQSYPPPSDAQSLYTACQSLFSVHINLMEELATALPTVPVDQQTALESMNRLQMSERNAQKALHDAYLNANRELRNVCQAARIPQPFEFR